MLIEQRCVNFGGHRNAVERLWLRLGQDDKTVTQVHILPTESVLVPLTHSGSNGDGDLVQVFLKMQACQLVRLGAIVDPSLENFAQSPLLVMIHEARGWKIDLEVPDIPNRISGHLLAFPRVFEDRREGALLTIQGASS